jgi:hypothetical protein
MLYYTLETTSLLDLGRSSLVDVVLILVFAMTMILGTVLGTP